MNNKWSKVYFQHLDHKPHHPAEIKDTGCNKTNYHQVAVRDQTELATESRLVFNSLCPAGAESLQSEGGASPSTAEVHLAMEVVSLCRVAWKRSAADGVWMMFLDGSSAAAMPDGGRH